MLGGCFVLFLVSFVSNFLGCIYNMANKVDVFGFKRYQCEDWISLTIALPRIDLEKFSRLFHHKN